MDHIRPYGRYPTMISLGANPNPLGATKQEKTLEGRPHVLTVQSFRCRRGLVRSTGS